jgi:hypothetical protein
MNKKELIAKIKEEIKITSIILKENKKAFKFNQRQCSIGLKNYLSFKAYPFLIEKLGKAYYKEVDGKYYYYQETSICNYDVSTAKSYLTCLHIAYNTLRNKKLHCHSIERNEYYVKWNKSLIEGMVKYEEEVQNAFVS